MKLWTYDISNPNDLARGIGLFIFGAAGVGLLLILLLAVVESRLEIFVIGWLLAISTTAAAGLGGFLFGIPRYTPDAAGLQPLGEIKSPDVARVSVSAITPNSNLEQVSDWLTKLLLGAGLVQLGTVGRWTGAFIDSIAAAMFAEGGRLEAPTGSVVIGSILILYAAFGFAYGYVVTTIWYQNVIRRTFNEEVQAILDSHFSTTAS